MTQESQVSATRSSDTVFVAIGLVLVALSAVVGVAVVWYTVGTAALAEAVSPAVISTVVFSVLVVAAASRSANFCSHMTTKNRSGQ